MSISVRVWVAEFLGFRALLTEPVQRHFFTKSWIVRFPSCMCEYSDHVTTLAAAAAAVAAKNRFAAIFSCSTLYICV